jgi:hypothetical protein
MPVMPLRRVPAVQANAQNNAESAWLENEHGLPGGAMT